MPSIESVRGLTVPTVAGDVGIWGGELNTTINDLAAILGTTTTLPSSTYGTAATLSSSQAQSARIVVGNTGAAPFQLNLPASNFCLGEYVVANVSSAAQNLTITAGSSGTGGATVVMPPNNQRIIYTDGVNVTIADDPFTATPVAVEIIIDGQGNMITPGQHGQVYIPAPMQITNWWVMADQAGSVTVDIWRANNAIPLSSQSIIGSSGNFPALSGAQFASSSPASWLSTALAKNDFIAFNVSSAATLASVQRITVALACARLD
jgi:hypothetical protein